MFRSLFFRILFSLLLASAPAYAQSLADVLSSVQERKRALAQASQISEYIIDYPTTAQTVNDQTLIEWTGLGGTQFPTDGDLSGKSIDERITLLNQAITEFRAMQTGFINVRKEDLVTASSKVGDTRPYLLEDFAELGRADASNYHATLAQLARSVRKLNVLRWPIAGYVKKLRKDSTGGSTIPSIGAGTDQNDSSWKIGSIAETCVVGGSYQLVQQPDPEDPPVPTWSVSKEEIYCDKVALYAKVPDRTDQINGKVSVVVRNTWSPVPATTVQVTSPIPWDPTESCFHVAMMQNNPNGAEFTMGATPSITVNLTWYTDPSGDFGYGYPTGYNLSNGLDFPANSWENELGVPNSGLGGVPYGNYVMGRRVEGLFAPTFEKGLDVSGKAAWLDKAELATATTAGDAKPMLHPAPGILAAISIGTGLDGSEGFIGITPGESTYLTTRNSENLGYWMGYSGPGEFSYPVLGDLSYRFDSAAALRFIGPAEDFHVVYETSRLENKRHAELPPLRPTTLEKDNMGLDETFFFRNWDLPRLKQVVSRDFMVNITPQGPYKNEVKIYRRPANAGSPARTPGEAIELEAGSVHVRTLLLDNPDLAANVTYPATPEKLRITDGTTKYIVCRGGYPEWDYKQSGYPGVNPANIYFEIQDGANTVYSQSMVFAGIGNVTATTTVQGTALSSEVINDEEWEWHLAKQPANRTITRGTQVTQIDNTFPVDPEWPNAPRLEWYPLSSDITVTDEPTIHLVWNTSGRLASTEQGSWKTIYSIEEGALKAESKFSNATYATTWTEWSNNDRTIKSYSAPDGSVSSKGADGTNWSELTLGNTSGTGLPGRPHQLTRKDGSGAAWTWNVANDFSGSLVAKSGLMSGTTLQTGQIQTTAWNTRSYTISSLTELKAGDTTTIASHAVQSATGWGAPTQWKNLHTNQTSSIAYEPGLNRPSFVTSVLGLTTNFTNYDVFNRPGETSSNEITATHNYTALSTTSTYGGTDVVAGSQTSSSTNVEGTTVSSGVTWGGVAQGQTSNRGASATTITGSHSQLGASSAELRKSDGSLSASTGDTLAFGGVTGDALSVVDGLLVTKSAVKDRPGTFAETQTDAWGRIRKIITPSKSGSGSTQTIYDYSLPGNPLKRVITTEPAGRILITESDANGTITRSGIDVNGNGELGSTDRYTESNTTVEADKVVTTLSVTEDSGLREILETKWTPSSGVTVTKINNGEETITTTPDYAAKTVTTHSNKGWDKTDSINNLGLATNSTLIGIGIPHAELKPVWRADGSLESVDFDIITGPNNQKETHSASFNPNGTLSSLIAPGRGNILGGHSISNGVETLTVNGVTNTAKVDGTQQGTSGANVIGKTDTLILSGSGYQKNTHPVLGADTQTNFNAALAATGKTYADNSGEAYGYVGERLASITLARGGALALGYSDNGAKDLVSAAWPAMASGSLTVSSIAHSFDYTRSGQIKTLGDPSGSRSLSYLNGRLSETAYTAGLLKGYAIIPGRDTVGRQTGTLIKRYGAAIHTTVKTYNGASDQISNLASGNITATPQRDGAGRITGYIWSDGTHSVAQTWTRGAGGRIEAAGSNVTGSPSFPYLLDPENPNESFDSYGRRLKCTTAGGTWTYIYGSGGQLVSATHPTLGTFTYAFDGIGRRTDKGTANTTDVLNRTTAWTNSQNKTVKVVADPNARVWFNGVEIENFTGTHNAAITLPPGASSGWVAWNTLAILEGAGEGAGNPAANPLASPDAKAEKKGAVWVPPATEALTYDAAGNRQSSAQWDFGWDAKNQLARARTKDYNTAAQGYDITFTYDAEGRRVKKHVIEYQAGVRISEKIITFVWDGWDLLYERHQLPSGLTKLERKYLWGPDIADGGAGGAGGLLLIRETKGSQTTEIIPLYDGTGHVVALTDINKNLLANYAYGPFGEKISATGPQANSNPWRFQTKYLDEETGLYYFGKRYYDPITGQFLSREPLGENESANLYQFGHGDPINNVDRLGLEAVAVDATLDNGIPTMVYEEWAGSGLAYMWNAFAAGKVKNWKQSPSSEQLAVNFYQEDGKWHLRSEEARHNAAWEMIPTAVANKMEEIKPVMDTLEIGGAAIASAPLVWAAGSLEVGGAAMVYGETMLSSIASTTWTAAGYSMTLGDALTIGGATWLFGTKSGHEWGTVVGSSGLSPQQTAGALGLDAMGGMLSKGRISLPKIPPATNGPAVNIGDGLAPSIRESFLNGKYSQWVADVDIIVYRGENFGQGSGRFFGLTKPTNSLDAEIMYNLNKWDNNATQLGEYLIPAGTRGFIGGVQGGTGIQLFLPNPSGVQLIERSTLFTSELKFIAH